METVRIAVYGTLMIGECNHHFCRNAVSIEPCTLIGALYDTGYGYPAFVPTGIHEVCGELVEIPICDLPAMDELEEVPTVYERRHHSVVTASGEKVMAWIYIMKHLPENASFIASGDWPAYRKGR